MWFFWKQSSKGIQLEMSIENEIKRIIKAKLIRGTYMFELTRFNK